MTINTVTRSLRSYFMASLFLLVGWASNTAIAQTVSATCPTDVADADNYAVRVTSLSPVDSYTIILDGTVEVDNATVPGGEYTSGNIAYTDGTGTTLLRLVDVTNFPLDTIDYIVHEVLCKDIDFDGDFDFSEATCDYTTVDLDNTGRGTIISTVAPYLGEQVYNYVLTDSFGVAITSNNTGYFDTLTDGFYNVYAFTFLDAADAQQMVDSITFGTTDMDDFSVTQPACFGFCGDVNGKTGSFYEIDCALSIDADPVVDVSVCNGTDTTLYVETTITGTQPPLTTVDYVWEVDSTGLAYESISDATSDSLLDLTGVSLEEDGNLYRAIAILYVDGVEIDRDTSGSGTLTVWEDATLAASMDTTVSTGSPIGVVFTDGSSNADSFTIVAINVPAIPGFTADAGNATTGSTTNASAIASDSYINDTGSPITVTYVVTPYSSNDCDGDPVTIIVVITPCPEVDAITATVCSDDLIAVTLPSADNNGATIDSFSITANSAGATTGLFTSSELDALENDVFNNTNVGDSIVTYTITPYAYGCEGSPFTITVTVQPEPAISDMVFSACSDNAIDVDLIDLTSYVGTGAPVDSFVVTAETNGLTGTATEGTFTTVDGIANDVFTNISGDLDSVIYTVIPYHKACAGESYTITVRITSEPVGSDPASIVCSDESLSITLQDLITNSVDLDSIAWFVEPANDNSNIVGIPTDTSSNFTLDAVLSNSSGTSQEVVYTVVPFSGTCSGDRFSITVTVNPEPVFDDASETVCSDEGFDIDLSASQTDTADIRGYIYTVNTPGSDRTDTTDTNIVGSFENTGDTNLVLTYTVTPISVDNCAGDPFEVVLTIQPEPVLLADLDDTVCSNSAIGVTLGTTTTSVAAAQYNVVSIDGNGLSNTATTPATTGLTSSTSVIAADQWENTGTSAVDVTYRIVPISANDCAGDTVSVVITIDPEPVVDAGETYTLCSNFDLTLADLGATIMGGTTTGSWSTSGSGDFVDVNEDPDDSFAGAVTYVPSLADKQSGGVTLTLTSSAAGTCSAGSDQVSIIINNVTCSEFPWNGN